MLFSLEDVNSGHETHRKCKWSKSGKITVTFTLEAYTKLFLCAFSGTKYCKAWQKGTLTSFLVPLSQDSNIFWLKLHIPVNSALLTVAGLTAEGYSTLMSVSGHTDPAACFHSCIRPLRRDTTTHQEHKATWIKGQLPQQSISCKQICLTSLEGRKPPLGWRW